MFKPKQIAVMVHPQVANAAEEAERMADFLSQRQVQVEHGSLYSAELRARVTGGEFNVLIALGGDGTMLRAGHLCAPAGTPILGINMGRFGFLTEVNRSDWQQALARLL